MVKWVKNGTLQITYYQKKLNKVGFPINLCKFANKKRGMDYKGAFLRFLTEAGVIEKVYDNCERPILGKLDDEEPSDWLLSLFLFERTREGSAFWFSIQDKWLNYLDEYERRTKE